MKRAGMFSAMGVSVLCPGKIPGKTKFIKRMWKRKSILIARFCHATRSLSARFENYHRDSPMNPTADPVETKALTGIR
jgi:hypothetical protein